MRRKKDGKKEKKRRNHAGLCNFCSEQLALYLYFSGAAVGGGPLFHAADALCAASDVWRILPGSAGGKA